MSPARRPGYQPGLRAPASEWHVLEPTQVYLFVTHACGGCMGWKSNRGTATCWSRWPLDLGEGQVIARHKALDLSCMGKRESGQGDSCSPSLDPRKLWTVKPSRDGHPEVFVHSQHGIISHDRNCSRCRPVSPGTVADRSSTTKANCRIVTSWSTSRWTECGKRHFAVRADAPGGLRLDFVGKG